MTLTFADTHNMIAYLTKSDASEGFNQIIDFLNASSIKYALTVNPNIYVSCIKQFWTSVAVKKVNDVTRLQALVDKKKVIITEDAIRDALRLADAEGDECLPNEEIFIELARMGGRRGMSLVPLWHLLSSAYLQVEILFFQIGDLSSHSTKYTSPALTQKVFANMRRVAIPVAGVVAEGAASVADNDVNADVLSMQDDEVEPAELQEVVEVVTTAKLITKVVTVASAARRRKVVIKDSEETTTPSTIIHSESKSKDKGKGILTKEQMDEEESRALKRINESQEDKAEKRQNLDEEVPVVDYEIYNEHNKPYYKIKRADGSDQLYLSFFSMLRNFDRENLEALWRLVKERFASTKPKNFYDDFLLTTLGGMFEKPDIQAQIWENQRSVHGQAKVKCWKLLESCGVRIITVTTTQLILLVERKYPLTRFTLDQMLNNPLGLGLQMNWMGNNGPRPVKCCLALAWSGAGAQSRPRGHDALRHCPGGHSRKSVAAMRCARPSGTYLRGSGLSERPACIASLGWVSAGTICAMRRNRRTRQFLAFDQEQLVVAAPLLCPKLRGQFAPLTLLRLLRAYPNRRLTLGNGNCSRIHDFGRALGAVGAPAAQACGEGASVGLPSAAHPGPGRAERHFLCVAHGLPVESPGRDWVVQRQHRPQPVPAVGAGRGSVPGRGLRFETGAPNAGRPRLHGPHPAPWGRSPSQKSRPTSPALGRGTDPLLAQPLPPLAHSLGQKARKLPGHAPFCLCANYVRIYRAFWLPQASASAARRYRPGAHSAPAAAWPHVAESLHYFAQEKPQGQAAIRAPGLRFQRGRARFLCARPALHGPGGRRHLGAGGLDAGVSPRPAAQAPAGQKNRQLWLFLVPGARGAAPVGPRRIAARWPAAR
nr:xylulose kinase-1 [Tanacetum cinerariifolium]